MIAILFYSILFYLQLDHIVRKFYYQFKKKSEKPGTWCKTISPEEFNANIEWRLTNLTDKYKKIHYIGDIQVCIYLE